MPLHHQPSKPFTAEQKAWADSFIGTYAKGRSTSWKTEGYVLRYTHGSRGNGIYLITDQGKIYKAFPKNLRG